MSINGVWCAAIIDQLRAAGCRHLVACPGNRDLPLLAAAATRCDLGLSLHPHLDERSGAFRALGLAAGLGEPVAIVTTSGSAVANCLPALCEAHAAGIPLILLGADRPRRLQGCGAPQTMPQSGIAAPVCAATIDCGDPSPGGLSAMIGTLRQALQQGLDRPGPVQVNVPLDDPMVPESIPAPQTTDPLTPGLAHPVDDAAIAPTMAAAQRGLVVAGPASPIDALALAPLMERGWPVITDAVGPLRLLTGTISCADMLLRGPVADLRPDCVLRLGPAPIARPVWEWLHTLDCPVIRCDRLPVERDFCHDSFHNAGRPAAAQWAEWCRLAGESDAAWAGAWRAAEAAAVAAWQAWFDQAAWSEALAAALAANHAPHGSLHLANSLAVRHANLHLRGGHAWRRVSANRGVNGIDGQLGTALGLAQATGPVRLLLGDSTALHDLACLPALAAASVDLQIVVIENGGGRIFDFLPVAQQPELQALVRQPQTVRFADCAEGVGLTVLRVADRSALAAALETTGGVRVIEVDCRGCNPAAEWRQLQERLLAGS